MTEASDAPAPATSSPRDVRALVHFGWACAEFRGRQRQLLTDRSVSAVKRSPPRKEYTLPLNQERSSEELKVQAEAELVAVAKQLELDLNVSELAHPPKDSSGTVLEHLKAVCIEAGKAEDAGARHKAWISVANVFHEWDTKVQDILASESATELAAYQLGRGLAEAYWSLDTSITDDGDARSWASLLGPDRCSALQRFMIQLTPAFGPITSPAVHASLDTWREIAVSPLRRAHPAAVEKLYEQIRNWHLLLVEDVDAASFITIHRLLAGRGSIWRIVRTFGAEAVLAVVGFASAIGAAVALTAFKSTGPLSAVLAVVGLFGVTAASVLAKAKDAANASLARMREAADHALVAEAVTAIPHEEHRLQLRWPIVRVPLPVTALLPSSAADQAKSIPQTGDEEAGP